MDKKIFGMIHLAGPSPIKKALEEIQIYEEEGLYGVIVENYHGTTNDVIYTLKELGKIDTKLKIGVNILPNEYDSAYEIADKFNADFIQLDYVSGEYKPNISLDVEEYMEFRNKFMNIEIMGGVWPKYYTPLDGSDLRNDLFDASKRADMIVVTGSGTGMETPLDKIKLFKDLIEKEGLENELIVGAGVTKDNIVEQMEYASGAIIGSAFKPFGMTHKMVDRELVREIMNKL